MSDRIRDIAGLRNSRLIVVLSERDGSLREIHASRGKGLDSEKAKGFAFSSSKLSSIDELVEQWNGFISDQAGSDHRLSIDQTVRLQAPANKSFLRCCRTTFDRPNDRPNDCKWTQEDEEALAVAISEMIYLDGRLREISRIVDFRKDNFQTTGLAISDLHMTVCSIVEAQFKEFLCLNNYGKERVRSCDYFKVAEPLRLHDYKVKLREFPWLTPFSPFDGWNSEKPTASLEWFARYTSAKHDRYNKGSAPRIIDLINGVCGLLVLLVAQFGQARVIDWRPEFFGRLEIVNAPEWLLGELYVHPILDSVPFFANT